MSAEMISLGEIMAKVFGFTSGFLLSLVILTAICEKTVWRLIDRKPNAKSIGTALVAYLIAACGGVATYFIAKELQVRGCPYVEEFTVYGSCFSSCLGMFFFRIYGRWCKDEEKRMYLVLDIIFGPIIAAIVSTFLKWLLVAIYECLRR